MPLIDLPLDQLLTYPGRNPKPADFDAYWDRAMHELDAVPTSFELTDAEFQVDMVRCQHVRFQGVGSAALHGRFASPRHATGPVPLLVMHHGYAWKAAEWFSLMPWVAAGFAVLAPDVRGQGGESQDPGGHPGNTLRGHIVRGVEGAPEDLFFRAAFLDAAQAARVGAVLPGVDPVRMGTFGASQGGGLAVVCAALCPLVRSVSSVYPFLSDYQRVWEMDQAREAYEEIRLHFRIRDPLHQNHRAFFERLGYVDTQHLASRIQVPFQMLTGLMDTTCPPSTQFAIYNKVASPKEYVLYPDFSHEGLPQSSEILLKFFQRTLG